MAYLSRCRVCLTNQGDLHSLFHKHKGCSPYDKLVNFVKVNMSRDSEPKLICSICISELDIAVNFLNKCQKTDSLLKDLETCIDHSNEPSVSPSRTKFKDLKDSADIFHGKEIQNKNLKSTVKVDSTCLSDIRKNKKQSKVHPCATCDVQSHCKHKRFVSQHTCNICGKQFNKKDNLIIHIKRHSGEREWGCELCGARRYTAGELRVHRRTHAGERPYACLVCPKKFTAKSNLKIHQLLHTGERPHECDVCGKRFISRNTLKIHNRTHTGEKPYVCAVCGKRFSSNKLTAHARTHSGERPHSCSQCSRAFGSRRSLTEHSRTHARPAPHPHACLAPGCHQRYTHKQSLNKHIRKQHPQMVNNATKPLAAPT